MFEKAAEVAVFLQSLSISKVRRVFEDFTLSVDTLAIRSNGLIKSASMKRSFFPGSCVTLRERYTSEDKSLDTNTHNIFCSKTHKQDSVYSNKLFYIHAE